jgi:hypothetical protein
VNRSLKELLVRALIVTSFPQWRLEEYNPNPTLTLRTHLVKSREVEVASAFQNGLDGLRSRELALSPHVGGGLDVVLGVLKVDGGDLQPEKIQMKMQSWGAYQCFTKSLVAASSSKLTGGLWSTCSAKYCDLLPSSCFQ